MALHLLELRRKLTRKCRPALVLFRLGAVLISWTHGTARDLQLNRTGPFFPKQIVFFSKKQSRFRYYSFPLQDVTSPTPITLERYFSKATGGGSPVFQMLLPKVSSEPIDLEGVSPRPAGLVTEWGGHIFHLVGRKKG